MTDTERAELMRLVNNWRVLAQQYAQLNAPNREDRAFHRGAETLVTACADKLEATLRRL